MDILGSKTKHNVVCKCLSQCVFEYLDPADSFLGLHHAYVLGGVPLRQQLSGAQVVSSKDNPINQVFWFAGSWDWAREKQREDGD